MTRLRLLAVVFVVGALAVLGGSASRANMAPPIAYRLGITLERTSEGAKVATVEKGFKGDRAGLKVGDLILGIDKVYAKSMSDDELKAFAADSHSWPIDLIIVRGTEIMTIQVPD